MNARRSFALPAAVLALACAVSGCAATAPPPAAGIAGPETAVALLPLENLSGRPENGDLVSRVAFVALQRTGRCRLIEPGVVDAALTELRVRGAGMLTAEDIARISERLGVRYLVLGALLECGPVRTPDGEIPSVGVALRLVSAGDARVLWSGMRVRTGEDRETVFGWGRERSLEKVAVRAVTDALADFRIPAAETAAIGGGGRP